jgi:hypothetical protein
MLDDLLHVSSQHADCLDNLGALAGIECANRARCFLQLVQQLNREAGEVVDEIEGVLLQLSLGRTTSRCQVLRQPPSKAGTTSQV